jgi:hypothetical protein
MGWREEVNWKGKWRTVDCELGRVLEVRTIKTGYKTFNEKRYLEVRIRESDPKYSSRIEIALALGRGSAWRLAKELERFGVVAS